jgi:hypothetical protein
MPAMNELKLRLQRSRQSVRGALDRVDNEQVRRARHLLQTLRRDPPDVLYLGDSALTHVAPGDTDRRRLKSMVDQGLGAGVSVHVVDGASFQADIYDAYLNLLYATEARPLVIVPLCIRVRFSPWLEHPVHGLKRPTARIRAVDAHRGAWRVRAAFPAPTRSDFETFSKVPYSNLLGERTVGDFVGPIRQFERSGDTASRTALLYAYHHGGLLTPATPAMDAVTRMGRTIRELGCRAVVYQTPVPVQMGSQLLGPALATRTTESFRVINEAYRLGAGAGAAIIESGTEFTTDEFLDPEDATEHLNERGRHHLADLIVAEVGRRLDGE